MNNDKTTFYNYNFYSENKINKSNICWLDNIGNTNSVLINCKQGANFAFVYLSFCQLDFIFIVLVVGNVSLLVINESLAKRMILMVPLVDARDTLWI